MRLGRNLQVERRIVHQYQAVGMRHFHSTLGSTQILTDFTDVAEHLTEAHIGHIAVVYKRLHTGSGSHKVAA